MSVAARGSRTCLVLTCLALAAAACGSNTGSGTVPSTPITIPDEIFSSVLAPRGTSSRSFTSRVAGTISVTLTDAGATIGVGVGLPRVTGGGCRLGVAVSANGGSTPQISVPADEGQYCVQVFDLGTLTEPVPFTLKVEHP